MEDNPKVESKTPRRRLSPEERREQLLDCAVTAYARLGVERAGHGDVAKIAGVSTATVFNYFATRELLTKAVLGFIRKRFKDFFSAVPDNTLTAAEQIRFLAITYESFTESQADMIKVMLNWSVAFGPDVRRDYLSFQNELLNELTRRLPGSGTDRSDARLILAAADMFAKMKLDNTDEDTIGRFVDRVVEALS